MILIHIENCLKLEELNRLKFSSNLIHPEYLLWSTSAPGIQEARRNYEAMETFGDTILKLGASLMVYELNKLNPDCTEGDLESQKVGFITNQHLFRVGFSQNLG